MGINAKSFSGLADLSTYYFKIEGNEYSVSTKKSPTYRDVAYLINKAIQPKFKAEIIDKNNEQDIIIYRPIGSKKKTVRLDRGSSGKDLFSSLVGWPGFKQEKPASSFIPSFSYIASSSKIGFSKKNVLKIERNYLSSDYVYLVKIKSLLFSGYAETLLSKHFEVFGNLKISSPSGAANVSPKSIRKTSRRKTGLGPGGELESTDLSGLSDNTTYYFKVNNVEYNITTGVSPTYQDVADLLNIELAPDYDSFTLVDAEGVDIWVRNKYEPGYSGRVDLDHGDTSPDLFYSLNFWSGFRKSVIYAYATGPEALIMNFIVGGTITISGVSIISYELYYFASGSAFTFGGFAYTIEFTAQFSAGGVAIGGFSLYNWEIPPIEIFGDGEIVLSGLAETSRDPREYVGDGEITLSGIAATERYPLEISYVGDGEIVLSGLAETSRDPIEYTGDGEVFAIGGSAYTIYIIRIFTGVMTLGGSATYLNPDSTWIFIGDGVVELNNYFTTLGADGIDNSLGIGLNGGTIVHVASLTFGAITISGVAEYGTSAYRPSGAITLGGSANWQRGGDWAGSDGAVLSGIATTHRDRFCIGSGTATLSGAAVAGWIPPNMVALFASAPGGLWSALAYSGLFPLGASEEGVIDLYSNTHDHSSVSNVFGSSTNTIGDTAWLTQQVIGSHSSQHNYNHSHVGMDHQPSYQQWRGAKANGASEIPTNAILFFSGTVLPTGWARASYVDGKYVKLNSSGGGESGVGYGDSTHVHSHPSSQSSGDVHVHRQTGYTYTHADAAAHSHTVPDHSGENNEPPFINLDAISPDTDPAGIIPSGVVAFFMGADVPAGWEVYSFALGKFIKVTASNIETTGGSSEHSHVFNDTSGSYYGSMDTPAGADGTTAANRSHDHQVSHTHAAVANNSMPLARELLICKKS